VFELIQIMVFYKFFTAYSYFVFDFET